MAIEKKLAKINNVRLGSGGYQDAMFGLTFDFTGPCWGIGDFWGVWSRDPDENTQWTTEDRIQQLGKLMIDLMIIMKQAKVMDLNDLVGIPVEITIENMQLKGWRILEEVL